MSVIVRCGRLHAVAGGTLIRSGDVYVIAQCDTHTDRLLVCGAHADPAVALIRAALAGASV
jgi:hypothetical protein